MAGRILTEKWGLSPFFAASVPQLTLLHLALLLRACIGAHAEENWPQWRGPGLNGVANAANLPLTWSETENIVWKTPLPSWSGATPVIWGDRILLTSPSKPAAESENKGAGGQSILLLSISKSDGKILWDREFDVGNERKSKQNNSSPSPVTDGNNVWVLSGNGTVAAFTIEGKELWKQNLQQLYGQFGLNFGYASSPLLLDGKLIVQVLHGYTTDAPSYLVAFDGLSGKILWRVERPTDAIKESNDAYTTPTLLVRNGTTQIVVAGGDHITGHDPQTGREIWRAGGLNPKISDKNRTIVSPVVADNMIYAGAARRPMLAYRAGGTGDITASNLAWKWDQVDGPDVPTPACDGKYFYVVNDKGIVWCLNAKTGDSIWGPERTAPGPVSTSPLVADDNVYITNESGVTTVLATGEKFQVLATNKLDTGERVLSSMIVSGNRLYLRGPANLYCIGK